MKKIDLGVIVTTLIIVTISCSLAFFAARVVGEPKDINLVAKNVAITFNDTSIIANGVVSPGWNTTKTFTITNNSKEEYKYNISIKDLINTFVTEGYLQYKITSTNDGYNMTEFKDIPKSSIATDTILAYSVVIPNGVTQSYTIEFKYANDENVDQSVDMNKKLSGTLFITEGTEDPNKTLYNQLLVDKSTKLTRTDFSKVLTDNNTKTLYTATEDGTTVYYFAGNATDNWVKFGGYYWRIIRTNSDGSIRLLYHGTSTDTTEAYINSTTYAFNSKYDDPMYMGYMYGTSGSLVNNRTNTNSSTVKGVIDTWYENNLKTNYSKYLSTTAVYCNDRNNPAGGYNLGSTNFFFAARTRLGTNKAPTFDCSDANDKFTADSSTGNGKLTYPIALMTADEVSFAGGVIFTNAAAWYYNNSANGSSTGETWWWLLSPSDWYNSSAFVYVVFGSSNPGYLASAPAGPGYNNNDFIYSTYAVRPVVSLKSCVKATGDGTSTKPYVIQETETGC